MAVDHARIANTLGKMDHYLSTHNSIVVMTSGGSDSDIIMHMIATHFRECLHKIHFVFVKIGLEYQATYRHLEYLEKRYDVNIDRIKGESVVSVVRREGLPILSKEFSQIIYAVNCGQPARTKDFWKKMEPRKSSRTMKVRPFPPAVRAMAQYLLDNNVKVSDRCCLLSKKRPASKYKQSVKCDMDITGERRAEGGIRAKSHGDCFRSGAQRDKYMPLYFWDDETKAWYKEHEGIVNSDCYEVWGMRRTGCVGCPFNSRVGEDLNKIAIYEPNLYKACLNVFGQSYEIMDRFGVHRKLIFDNQITLDGMEVING